MIVYIALITIGLFLLTGAQINRRLQFITAAIITALMIFFASFRYQVGVDYNAYTQIFAQVQKYMFDVDTDPGFALLCKGVGLIGGTYQLMFLIMAVSTITIFYFAYKKYSPDMMFTMFTFLCVGQLYINSFNGMRQMLAVGIFMYALEYIYTREWKKYFGLILFSALFHASALILVPLYWIINRKAVRWVSVLVLVLLMTSGKFLLFLILNSPYATYLRFSKFAAEAGVAQYLYFFLSALILAFSPSLLKKWKYRNIFLNLNTITLLMYGLFFVFENTPLVAIAIRLVYYSFAAYAVTFVKIIYDMKQPAIKYSVMGLYIVMIGFLFIRASILESAPNHTLPFLFNFKLFA